MTLALINAQIYLVFVKSYLNECTDKKLQGI